ncbi:TonB-dependent receptor, putative [Arcticibacter svalbardensis MN12-7]|uniref:TonB-dependent receptor, putative n=1 Tax=Arcticibacter svalbardensis MN12-7 TaxID=1150600 RepID=R9GU90_9SPHI|nr:outer membrane beta-barrel protein [Arcticibacter svalbardensis]EOR95233.1 TonB-dependent receptor, putative [Arcticibacter svalbardensis MN12-7]
MKRIIALFAFVIYHSFLFSQDRRVTLELNHEPISLLFNEIKKQCQYNVVYSDDLVSDTISVSIDAKMMPVAQVLSRILPSKKLCYYFVSNKLIVITKIKDEDDMMEAKSLLRGKVVDAKGEGIPFTSIGLFENNSFLIGTVSSLDGNYQLAFRFQPGHSYFLKTSYVGFKPLEIAFTYPDTINSKRIQLIEDQLLLKTVNVTADNPFIERRVDRYIVNVEKSSFAQGFSAWEVLQKSPGVWVSSNGSIRLKGNQSVMVMINDMVQRMSQEDLAEYLNSLRSDEISKIEIIYNPPSEFEAAGAGGIIHIVLKKSRKDGITGSVYSRYQQQGKNPFTSTGGSLAYKVKKIYISGNISYTKDKNKAFGQENIIYPDNSVFNNVTDRYNNISRSQYRLGIAYDISSYQSIGIQNTGALNRPVQVFLTDINYQKEQPLLGTARADWERRISFNSTTLNYVLKLDSLGSSLKVIGDYSKNGKNEENKLATTYNDSLKNSASITATPSSTSIYAGQVDYTKTWSNKTEFKAGVKYTSIKRDNQSLNENYFQNEWLFNPLGSNHFIYSEQLMMLYSSWEKNVNKTSIKLGLRAEETVSNGNSITSVQSFNRNYLGLFPSFYLMQMLNESKRTSLYFNYSRRLQRPSFNDLNPYRLQVHDYSILTGNPDLLPQYTNNYQAGYIFFKNYTADIYFSATKNLIALLATPLENNVMEYKSFNFNNGKEYGLNLSIPVNISKIWTVANNLSLYRLSNEVNNVSTTYTTLYAKSIQTLNLKKIMGIDVIAEYKSPSVVGNTRLGYMFYLDIMFSRKIMKEKGVFRIYCSDVLNTVVEKELTIFNNTTIDYYQKRQTRNVSLSFSYNFSLGKKFTQKNIEQSNKEENRRMGN